MKTIKLKSILLEFFNKKIIDVLTFIEMQSSLENFTLVEDFLIECIRKYNIHYMNYPDEYKSDIEFLKKVIEIRPCLTDELKKSNSKVNASLNSSMSDKSVLRKTKFAKNGESRIRKINAFISTEQVG